MKIKKISINEIEKLDLFKSMNWSSIVEKQIELLGDSISIEEKTFYRTIVSNPNPELIKLLPYIRCNKKYLNVKFEYQFYNLHKILPKFVQTHDFLVSLCLVLPHK